MNEDMRPSAGTSKCVSTNEPDPFPITERMFNAMVEYGRNLPNEANPEDDDLDISGEMNMKTLIKRLRELQEADAARKWEGAPGPNLSIGNEAADEVERLGAEVKALEAEVGKLKASTRSLLRLLRAAIPVHDVLYSEIMRTAETLCKE